MLLLHMQLGSIVHNVELHYGKGGQLCRAAGTYAVLVTKKVFTHSSAYAASKNGLMAYTNVLREEVRKHKIKVVNIIPGATITPMWPQNVRKESSERMMEAEGIARLLVWIFLQKENMISEEIVVRPIEGDL